MHLKKDYHYLVIFIFFTITSFLIANQVGFDRHWSSNFDHEFTLTYNALLFNGGLYHEYLDHPGFFSILFLSLLFQFLSFFDLIDVYKISLLSSENFDTAFQEIIIITRIYSTICVSLFASICYFFFFTLIKNKYYSFISTLLVFFSIGTMFHLTQLRTELLAMTFLVLSITSLKIFLEENKKNEIIYLALFFLFFFCSLFNKMQIFFLFPLFLVIIYFCNNKIGDFNIEKFGFLKNKLTPYIFLIIIILYLYIDNKNLYPFPILSSVAILFNIFLMNLFFYLLLKTQSNNIKLNLIVINFIFILIYLIFKNLISIHPATNEIIFINITRIMHLSQYVPSVAQIGNDTLLIKNLFINFFINTLNLFRYEIFTLNNYSFLIITNIILLFIFRKALTLKDFKFNFSCLISSILIMIINSFRMDGSLPVYYLIFSDLILICSLTTFSKLLKLQYLLVISIIFITINFQKNLTLIHGQKINDTSNLCNGSYLIDWHKKIKPEFYKDFCNSF